MGWDSVVGDLETGEGCCADHGAVVEDAGVGDEGYVGGGVGARVEEQNLAANGAFFTWSAENEDFAWEGVEGEDVGGGEACC